MVDLVERLEVMLEQELSYETVDYLAPSYQEELSAAPELDCPVSYALGASSTSSSSTINETWREKICEWSYQVIDHFDFSREVVSISMHYLDRYLATRSVSKKIFQLAAMTCLYLAIKLYEPGRLSMSSMIELSRGYFTVEQMSAMELIILRAMKWQVHPPTAYCFAKHLALLLSTDCESMAIDRRQALMELARFLTELSVIDYFFVVHRPSVIAIAALLNALHDTPGIDKSLREPFATEVERITGIQFTSDDVSECRDRLRRLYVRGGYFCPYETETRPETDSPICVSQFPERYDIAADRATES